MTDTLTQRARDAAGRLKDGPYTVGPASGEIRELSEAAAIISELVERIEGMWQDIETFAEPTALSSGEGVLIACRDGSVGEAYFRNFGDVDDGWWWSNTSWGDYPEPDRPSPVAWTPLPPPPSVLGKQEGEG